MIKVFFGTDTIAVRSAALTSFDEASYEVVDSNSFESGLLADLAEGQSLFGGTTGYLLDTPSERSEFAAEVAELLPVLGGSPHTFVIIETSLLAATKKMYQKHAAELTEYKAGAPDRFNTFALADAMARKDKKLLWLLLHEAKAVGQSAEEMIGILWWQLKTLRLAAVTSSATEAGIKDYPYQKAKRALNTFSCTELEALSTSLLQVYHDGHGGVVDIDLALERWCLRL